MACFIVPVAEAIVTTIAQKVIEKKEKGVNSESKKIETKIHLSTKLKWLSNMLWGGSALLAFEHIWHGEVTPWFPFLTAAQNSSDTLIMLKEMSTVGVSMAVLVTAFWGAMVLVSSIMEKQIKKTRLLHQVEESI